MLRSSTEDSYELKKQRLVSVIKSLHEPDATILMAAFELDSSAESSMVSALGVDWIRLRDKKPRPSSNHASSF